MVEYKSSRESSTSILEREREGEREREREIKPSGVYRNMKGCIIDANCKRQDWVSTLFTIILILTMELRYPKKRGSSEKEGKFFCLVGG